MKTLYKVILPLTIAFVGLVSCSFHSESAAEDSDVAERLNREILQQGKILVGLMSGIKDQASADAAADEMLDVITKTTQLKKELIDHYLVFYHSEKYAVSVLQQKVEKYEKQHPADAAELDKLSIRTYTECKRLHQHRYYHSSKLKSVIIGALEFYPQR